MRYKELVPERLPGIERNLQLAVSSDKFVLKKIIPGPGRFFYFSLVRPINHFLHYYLRVNYDKIFRRLVSSVQCCGENTIQYTIFDAWIRKDDFYVIF